MLVEIRKYRSSGLCGDWEQPGNKHNMRMNGTPRRSRDARNMEASFQKAEEHRTISCNVIRYYLIETQTLSRFAPLHTSYLCKSDLRSCAANAFRQWPSWPSCGTS